MKTTRFYMSILLLFLSLANNAQDFHLSNEIGHFTAANAFSINQSGFIFVCDAGTNEIVKMDTLGNVLKTIGGYGRENYLFDEPADIFANTLNVYVADRNNDRIQIYDKDLNYLSTFSTPLSGDENYSFRYPTGIAVYSQGDFFVLDSDNARILKFNFRGELQTAIGGYDNANYVFDNPKKIAMNGGGKIFVIDEAALVLFDTFGNFIKRQDLDFEPDNINIGSDFICLSADSTIYYSRIDNASANNFLFNSFEPGLVEKIENTAIFNSKLYLLTGTKILIYKITGRKN